MKRPIAPTGLAALALLAACNAGGCGGVEDKSAAAKFQTALGQTTITIYPAYLRGGRGGRYDDQLARDLAGWITERGLATATSSSAHVPLRGRRDFNQARMLRESVEDFAAYVRSTPPDSTYAALPELLVAGDGSIAGVHLYVLDRQGACAYALGLNSHHAPFQRVNPKTPADGLRVIQDVLNTDWKAARGQKP